MAKPKKKAVDTAPSSEIGPTPPELRPGDLESYDAYLRWIIVALQRDWLEKEKAFELRKGVDSLRQLAGERHRQSELAQAKEIQRRLEEQRLEYERIAQEQARLNTGE